MNVQMDPVTLLFILWVSFGIGAENPVVETPLGTIQGYFRTSYNGTKYSAFEGIPFAKAPIGDRRFELPEPIEPWEEVLNATLPTVCPQTDMLNQEIIYGTEDCLHINVYVPRELINPEEKLDVFVHIHGGAFIYGSSAEYANPEFIMDRELIFVTFNYRLGILGFLSTEDEVVPGNNGLKDQVLALRWIQENIASFGGNPDSVTLSGASAGSMSVHFHYFAEQSRGLFHRGWAESGLGLVPVALVEGNLEKAQTLGDALDCPISSTREMVNCLKEVPFEKVAGKMSLFLEFNFLPIVPFGPVVEKAGSTPFLGEHPYLLLSRGELYDVPFLVSNDRHEGSVFTNAFTDLDFLDQNWETLLPFSLDFSYTLDESLWQNASKKIREYYFGDAKISSENYLTLVQLFTDREFFVDTLMALKMHAQVMESPVYYYMFSYPGENNPSKIVGHGAEAIYIYGFGTTYPYTTNDLKMRDLFWDMISSFASTGKPIFGGVEWNPTTSDEIVYINIMGVEEGEVTLETRQQLAPEEFWHSFHFAENAELFV